MRSLSRRSLVWLFSAVLLVGLAAPALTQTQDAATEAWVLPRTSDGYPDMQGNWSHNMKACQAAIVEKNGFNWQLFKGRECFAIPATTDAGILA